MCQSGQPIRELLQDTILASDKVTTWHSKCPDGVPEIVDDRLVEPGCPSARVALQSTPLDLFNSFISEDMITGIVTCTNVKIGQLRDTLGPLNRKKSSYKDTSLLEMRCFIGVLIMSGSRKDNHLRAREMFSSVYGCGFYKSLFS